MKVGLLGAGAMGRRHLTALSRDARVTLVGVADAVENTARAAAEAVGARACRDLAGLAECGAEAVFITLPNVHHGPVVLEALARDLHVFSEKPMATSLAEGRAILDRVRRGRRVYQMGFNRRWFIDACLGQAPPPVGVEDAFHSLAVLDAAYASLRQGGRPVLVTKA